MKSIILTLIITFFLNNLATAQFSDNDINLINNYKKTDIEHKYSNTKTIISDKKSKFNPIAFVLRISMYSYQNLISPIMSSDCAYDLSCSNYSKHAIKEYGYVKGIFLSSDRLMRCQHTLQKETPFYKINQETGKMIDTPDMYRCKKHKH